MYVKCFLQLNQQVPKLFYMNQFALKHFSIFLMMLTPSLLSIATDACFSIFCKSLSSGFLLALTTLPNCSDVGCTINFFLVFHTGIAAVQVVSCEYLPMNLQLFQKSNHCLQSYAQFLSVHGHFHHVMSQGYFCKHHFDCFDFVFFIRELALIKLPKTKV